MTDEVAVTLADVAGAMKEGVEVWRKEEEEDGRKEEVLEGMEEEEDGKKEEEEGSIRERRLRNFWRIV